MKLQAIFEGVSPILFHTTSPKSAEMILKSNSFRLTTDLGSDFEKTFREGNRTYFLSTSRSRVGRFQGSRGVTFVLDGRKLGNNYKGKPIDFFTADSRRANPQNFEHEDRVFSGKPEIPNASKYINEIHVKVDISGSAGFMSTKMSQIRKLVLQAKARKIPIYLYDNPRAWLLQNKKKSIKISDANLIGSDQTSPIPLSVFNHGTMERFQIIFELYHKRSMKELSKVTQREMSYLFNAGYGADKEMTTVIHNARTGGYKGKSRQMIEKLTGIMKKEKVSDIRALYDILNVKWEKIKRIEKFMKGD